MIPSVVLDSERRFRDDTAGIAERWARISSALRDLCFLLYLSWILVLGVISVVKRAVEGSSETIPLYWNQHFWFGG